MLVRLRIALGIVLILCGVAIAGLHALTNRADRASGAPARLDAPQAPTPGDTVVVARTAIERGRRIRADALTLMRVQGPLIGAPYTDMASVTGGTARQRIAAGQILLPADVTRADGSAGSLALLVPPGMRAVALSVNDEVAVGSFVTASDRVDIQLVFSAEQVARLALSESADAALQSRVLLQDIEVLSTGETLRVATDGKAVRMRTLTVAVAPRQAQLLAVAKETGSFYLALRHPEDRMTPDLPPFSARQLSGAPPRQPADAHRRTVEVLSGGASRRQAVEDRP